MLAAVVAGGVLLLGVGVASGAEIVVVRTLGRKVVEVKTASARWTASAQGEYVDDNYVTKPDPNALRGRAAVKEVSGVQRIRIHDVTLQQQDGGVWKTIAQRTADVVNERPTAYAVAYTPTVKTCWSETVSRAYRVVQNYGVRQSSGTATNRSLTSNTFQAPALASDPGCPVGAFNAWLSGPPEAYVGDPVDVYFESNWVGLNDQPVEGVLVRIDFDDTLEVTPVELDGLEPLADSDDPNDYGLLAASWPSSNENQVAAQFVVTPTQAGTFTSQSMVSTGAPRVEPAPSDWEVTVTAVEG